MKRKSPFTGRISRSLLLGILLFNCASSTREAPESEDLGIQKVAQDCLSMSEVRFQDGLATHHGQPISGKVCSYFRTGEIHTLTTYREGEKEGLWEVFYQDGKREKSGFTRRGKDDGLYREYYPNGRLKYEYHYDLGKKVDVWKSWYADGTPYTERHFEDDRLNGKVLVWDENGKLAKEYDYVDGRLVKSEMHFKKPGY